MDPSWQPVLSAAQRRKQRRLRSWWRHEQQSIAAALATFTHHSALRGQKTARAGEEESETKYTAKFRTTPPPHAAGTEYYELSDDDVVPARGSRPPCLGEPRGPQERDQLRTVEQIAVFAPMVQILDAPVPQFVEQLPDVLRFFDRFAPVPEQVIAVPKIFIESVPPRAFLRATQLAEQLVEVPTIISFSLMSLLHSLLAYKQGTEEQNVDIPAVGGIGTGGGSSGFLPRQSTSETAEQIVEIPVPRPHGVGDLQGFPRGPGSTAFTEQITEVPDPGGGQNFQPVQGSAASSSDFPGQADQGVFRTFPQNKKSATHPPHSTSALPPHSSPWTPAPYDASMVLEEEEEEEEEECEEDFAVEYVEYDNRFWGREWDPARQRYCWWLASADLSQVGHAIWRPPWLIGRGPG